MENEKIKQSITRQRRFFEDGRNRSKDVRITHLKRLLRLVTDNDGRIINALKTDMRKPPLEAYASEIAVVKNEIRYAMRSLHRWMHPVNVSTPLPLWPSRSFVVPEPLGVVLIISPWNYPFHLAFAPLVGALAAGNCAVIKPSELAPNTAQLMDELISEAFEPGLVTVIQGNVDTARTLLEERFDHIFFTGSTAVGRVIMEAAAKHLTPVTLELGGKSPCIVDSDVDISLAAKRITWAKFFNAGQTCVAPDYLLVDNSIKPAFLESLGKWISTFYGTDPALSPDYSRIINDGHFRRLQKLMGTGEIIIGGRCNQADLYIEPTLIDNISPEDPVMQEEIFGPLLPVIGYKSINEAISFVNSRPKPLAMYAFSNSKSVHSRIIKETSSGGVCINDAMVHVASHSLPFGGVGDSGIGAYHGLASFAAFSHNKAVVRNTLAMDVFLRYIPYRFKLPLVRWFF